ncbi:MAG: DUF4249 family protein [Ginsengibacter sp.]
MKAIFSISIFLCVIILCSCEKIVTIKQQQYQSKLSIQGLITPGQKPAIYINRTVPYFDPKINTRALTVDNATVVLNDGTNNYSFQFDSSYDYFYCRYDYFYKGAQNIQANKTYTLTVNYNGNIYTAVAVTNQSVVPITSTGYTPDFTDLYGGHEGVIIKYTDKPGEENFYRYEMGRIIDTSVLTAGAGIKSNCLGDQTYYIKEIGRTIYPDKNVDGLALSFEFEPAYTHQKDDTAYIHLQSVDKNIFNFYNNLDEQKLAQYNPFVEPVFIAPGQFKDAIGVFGAYAVSDSVLFIYPE